MLLRWMGNTAVKRPKSCKMVPWMRSQKSESWTEPFLFDAQCQANTIGMMDINVVAKTTAMRVELRYTYEQCYRETRMKLTSCCTWL